MYIYVGLYTYTMGRSQVLKAEGHLSDFKAPTLKIFEAACMRMGPHPCLSQTLTAGLPSAVAFLSQESFPRRLICFLFVPCHVDGCRQKRGLPHIMWKAKAEDQAPFPPDPLEPHFLMSDPHWLKTVVSKLQIMQGIVSVSCGQGFKKLK